MTWMTTFTNNRSIFSELKRRFNADGSGATASNSRVKDALQKILLAEGLEHLPFAIILLPDEVKAPLQH